MWPLAPGTRALLPSRSAGPDPGTSRTSGHGGAPSGKASVALSLPAAVARSRGSSLIASNVAGNAAGRRRNDGRKLVGRIAPHARARADQGEPRAFATAAIHILKRLRTGAAQ